MRLAGGTVGGKGTKLGQSYLPTLNAQDEVSGLLEKWKENSELQAGNDNSWEYSQEARESGNGAFLSDWGPNPKSANSENRNSEKEDNTPEDEYCSNKQKKRTLAPLCSLPFPTKQENVPETLSEEREAQQSSSNQIKYSRFRSTPVYSAQHYTSSLLIRPASQIISGQPESLLERSVLFSDSPQRESLNLPEIHIMNAETPPASPRLEEKSFPFQNPSQTKKQDSASTHRQTSSLKEDFNDTRGSGIRVEKADSPCKNRIRRKSWASIGHSPVRAITSDPTGLPPGTPPAPTTAGFKLM